VNNIARELGKLDPDNAKLYTQNARAYAKRLRALRAEALAKVTEAPGATFRVATIHAAYDYLVRDFGLEVTAVVDRLIPADGLSVSGSEAGCVVFMDRQLASWPGRLPWRPRWLPPQQGRTGVLLRVGLGMLERRNSGPATRSRQRGA
jgi:hypothetical protein